mmetsp:Transcript_116895/g.372211  ORF Transcript_116895/g.372211 Transcript_116895/m.372211 type:complete len:88 (-) Transcript_116895:839-1102(-)
MYVDWGACGSTPMEAMEAETASAGAAWRKVPEPIIGLYAAGGVGGVPAKLSTYTAGATTTEEENMGAAADAMPTTAEEAEGIVPHMA